jgi:hypothetical protein
MVSQLENLQHGRPVRVVAPSLTFGRIIRGAMKLLLLLMMATAISCAQNTPNTAKPEPTKTECHSAYAQNHPLSGSTGCMDDWWVERRFSAVSLFDFRN